MSKNFTPERLKKLYIEKKKSVSVISKTLKCSENKVNYWLNKHNINKRSISDAIYLKHNPDGDPFRIIFPKNIKEAKLFGLGLGLYWGEGDKSGNNTQVRIGNTDPRLIKKFKEFLVYVCGVKKRKIRYSLIVFNNADKKAAINFWKRHLKIPEKRLGKITIIPPQGKGTYKKKNQSGVLIITVINKKLKEKILGMIKNI